MTTNNSSLVQSDFESPLLLLQSFDFIPAGLPMLCVNSSMPGTIFSNDLSSYGLIGFVFLGLILYVAYVLMFARNHRSSSSTSVYIYFSQISLFFLLLSPLIFVFRANVSLICSMQSLAVQILPFCLLLGFNVHFAYQWLLKMSSPLRNNLLIGFSAFLIFFLALLIQTAILLVWFCNHSLMDETNIVDSDDDQTPWFASCTEQCHRPYFLASLIFQYFLLFLYSIQSSLRYHLSTNVNDLIYLLTSLFALTATLIWIAFYLFLPLRTLFPFHLTNETILAYGCLFLIYAFLGPFLYEQLFYHHRTTSVLPQRSRFHPVSSVKENQLIDAKLWSFPLLFQINKMTFKCLSLTKEQQRAFMDAYIKRNLTVSCENLTGTMISSSHPEHHTRHSTLSEESLCPTLISTISHDLSPPVASLASHDQSRDNHDGLVSCIY